ncbi:MAG: Cas10/Cmr2 second palm domain-containing protein [Thermodesulfobacteriota bacterium]
MSFKVSAGLFEGIYSFLATDCIPRGCPIVTSICGGPYQFPDVAGIQRKNTFENKTPFGLKKIDSAPTEAKNTKHGGTNGKKYSGVSKSDTERVESGGGSMDMNRSQLVVMDFPGIKQYVFGTDRLVEIRGASALLDQLNRKHVPELMRQYFGNEQFKTIFSGGGSAQFIVNDTPVSTKEKIRKVQGEIYLKTGGALNLFAGIALYQDDYHKAIQQAFFDLKRNIQQHPFRPCSSFHTGFIKECESCSGMASDMTQYAGEDRWLCQVCIKKENAGRQRGLWKEFSVHLEKQGRDPNQTLEWRPSNFEEIGDRCEARPGYTALVYGDGNAMGQLVKQINTQDRFQRFSQTVDEAVRDACYEALWLCYNKPIAGKIPSDILLLGGDDIIVYLTADKALPFAIEAAKRFEEKTRQKLCIEGKDDFFRKNLNGRGLTLSLGIAYAKSHTPISMMVDQAEELLKIAKKKGTDLADGCSYTPACLDFHFSNHFNQVSVSDSRCQHLIKKTSSNEKIRLYRGPYTLDEAEALFHHAYQLKQSGMPSSRIHRMGDAPFMGKVNATIETMTLLGRCESQSQRNVLIKALDHFGCTSVIPWKIDPSETTTVIVDLLKIAEFIKKENHPYAP